MKFIYKYLRLLVFIGICLPLFANAQYNIPPKSNKLVNDYAGVLNESQVAALENEAVAFDNKTSTQIAIVTIKSLEGQDIDGYCQELAETWGIGQKDKDNGMLILVAIDNHKIKIATGRGTTQYASASRLGTLERNEMNPYFKKGDYYGGLSNGLNQLIKLLDGKYEAEPKYKKSNHWSSFLGMAIIIIIIIISSIRRNKFRGGGGSGMGTGFFLGSMFSGGGGFGGGSSGGGGGGFGGFGGGSFGGGGASSSW